MRVRLRVPSKEKIIKGVLAVLGAILVGAVGSGVWSWLLAPGLQAAGRGLLNVASLGFHSYKDRVYQLVAIDDSEAISIFIAHGVIIFFVAGIYIGLRYTFNKLRRVQQRNSEMLESLSESPDDLDPRLVEERAAASRESIKIHRKNLLNEGTSVARLLSRIRIVMYVISFAWISLIGSVVVSIEKLAYVNSARAHYHQALRTASPYLESQDRLLVESQFAQVRNRQDYVNVLKKLENTCKDHGQNVPAFTVW